jgi:hypothetical protein
VTRTTQRGPSGIGSIVTNVDDVQEGNLAQNISPGISPFASPRPEIKERFDNVKQQTDSILISGSGGGSNLQQQPQDQPHESVLRERFENIKHHMDSMLGHVSPSTDKLSGGTQRTAVSPVSQPVRSGSPSMNVPSPKIGKHGGSMFGLLEKRDNSDIEPLEKLGPQEEQGIIINVPPMTEKKRDETII